MTRIHLKTEKQFRKNRRSRQEEDREVVHVTEDVTKSALAQEKENDMAGLFRTISMNFLLIPNQKTHIKI